MLAISDDALARLVAHCVASQPHEGCGLLVGDAGVDATVHEVVAMRNIVASALVYELDPAEHLVADRDAQARGLDVLGAFHSHTHTDAWPSATDVAAAVDPSWHWVVVSLRDADAVVRSFVIEHGEVTEERVEVRQAVGRAASAV